MTQATIEIPARLIEMTTVLTDPSEGTVETHGTLKAGFEKVKHLLSSKPLMRPARRLTTAPPAPADEEAERQRLMRRMPPRSRIEEIARKTPSPDPWLDDRYDWRP